VFSHIMPGPLEVGPEPSALPSYLKNILSCSLPVIVGSHSSC